MICFAWWGFPQYAARCVRAFVQTTDEEVVVIATRPTVPIKGMEELCGCRVFWIEQDDDRTILKLLGTTPRVIFTSGWAIPAFNRYANEVRANGGKVVAMIDNNYRFSLAEMVRAMRFRLKWKKCFSGYFVPGKSAHRLVRFYGVDDRLIGDGLYVADPELFYSDKPLVERGREIIYVGQFIERKNVMRMCRAFLNAKMDGWTLRLYGSGPLKEALRTEFADTSIEINDFAQPEELAGLYRRARVFCLPSLDEHWGVVVHEAALSGCYLLLSRGIGAADDFLGEKNSAAFDPFDEDGMTKAFRKIGEMTESDWNAAYSESLEMAKQHGFDKFVNSVKRFVNEVVTS